jgi:hypothetical protein
MLATFKSFLFAVKVESKECRSQSQLRLAHGLFFLSRIVHLMRTVFDTVDLVVLLSEVLAPPVADSSTPGSEIHPLRELASKFIQPNIADYLATR